MAQDGKPSYTAPALEKGLDIVELLASTAEPMSQQQIAARLERTTSEIFRMLNVLVRRGYVSREADGTYAQTLKQFDLAHRHSPVRRLVANALPVMQRVSRLIGQSTHLVVHYDRKILVVAQVDSSEPSGFCVRLGSHYPFRDDRGSVQVLTAFQPPEEQAALIDEIVTNGLCHADVAALRAALAALRRRGYYKAASAVVQGVTEFSFPVFGGGSGAIAALASPYIKQRDVAISLSDTRAALAEAARDISISMGAHAG
ncbi:MAG: helix-turn-helix domain-containing protein [Burkholderiaceae bacterium]|nr:helix-turn-helix domain-containing protein [Burkholderiaceae bacterium]